MHCSLKSPEIPWSLMFDAIGEEVGVGEPGERNLGRAAYYICSQKGNLHVHWRICNNERLTES